MILILIGICIGIGLVIIIESLLKIAAHLRNRREDNKVREEVTEWKAMTM